jgi:hypothetical protein
LVVDFLAIYVLKEKTLYEKYKYLETADFTVLRNQHDGSVQLPPDEESRLLREKPE